MEAFGTASNHYSILETISNSALYREYKALRQSDGALVFLHVYLPDRTYSTAYLEAFRRQAELLTLVEHPNLLQVLDYGVSDEGAVLVSDYFEGASLEGLRKRLSVAQAAHLLYPIADAIDNLHTQNLFHGMLEPEFIRISPEGQIKLFGFGLFPILNFEDRRGVPDELVGIGISNPSYTPPEQYGGRGEPVPHDLYAMGAILYRLLTTRDPFQASSPMHTVVQRLARSLTWPAESNRISPAAVRIVQKALARNPEQRFQRAEEMRNVFEKLSIDGKVRIALPRAVMRGAPLPLLQTIMLGVLVLLVISGMVGGLWYFGYLARWMPTVAFAVPVRLYTPTTLALRATATSIPKPSQVSTETTPAVVKPTGIQVVPTKMVPTSKPQTSAYERPVLLGERLLLDNLKPLTVKSVSSVQEIARYGTGKLIQAAWSPKNNELAIVSTAGVYLIDVQEAQIQEFIDPGQISTAVVFSQDGTILAIGLGSGEIILWDMNAKQEIRRLAGHTGRVSKLIFARNGKMLFSSSYDHTIRRWDFQTGKELQTIAAHTAIVRSFDISNDARFMVTGGDDGLVKYWDVDPGTVIQEKAVNGAVWSVALSPSNDRYAAGTEKGTVSEWFVSTHNPSVDPYNAGSGIWTVVYQDDTHLLFFTDDGVYQGWSLSSNSPTNRQLDKPVRNRALIDRLGWDFEYNRYLAWQPATNLAALVSWSGTVQIFEGISTRIGLYEMPYEDFNRLAISPNSRYILASGERDQSYKVVPSSGANNLYDGTIGQGQPFSPDSQLMLIQSSLYPTESDGQYPLREFPTTVIVGYALNGRALVVSTLNETWVYDMATKKETYHTDGRFAACRSIFQRHDGSLLATISNTHFVPLENDGIRWYCNMLDHGGVNIPAISPDLQRMAFINVNGLLEVWDTEAGQFLWRAELEHPIRVISFNQNHRLLATAGEDGSITLWNTEDGSILITLRGHFQKVKTMQFSPDGKYLATAGSDGTLRLWGVP